MSEHEQTPTTTPAPTPAETTTPAPNTHEESGDNTTLMGILSYLGPLVFIPFFTAKDQPFVRFHVRQGLVLFVPLAILWIADEMFYFGPLWQLLDFIYLAIVVFSIIGIINVINKQEKELPLIGQFAKHFKF